MSVKVTVPNGSSDYLTFGSANTPDAAKIGGYDDGSSAGHMEFYTTTGGTSIERMRIDSSGNILVANNSSANLTNFTTQALTTGSQSGYIKLPNGLIIQWGRVTFAGTSATVTFPIAFPNAFWGIAGIPKYGSGVSIAFNGESTTGLTLRTSINTGDYFPYIAYGY